MFIFVSSSIADDSRYNQNELRAPERALLTHCWPGPSTSWPWTFSMAIVPSKNFQPSQTVRASETHRPIPDLHNLAVDLQLGHCAQQELPALLDSKGARDTSPCSCSSQPGRGPSSMVTGFKLLEVPAHTTLVSLLQLCASGFRGSLPSRAPCNKAAWIYLPGQATDLPVPALCIRL